MRLLVLPPLLSLVLGTPVSATRGNASEDANLWEWQNPAPIVAIVEIEGEVGRAVIGRVRRVLLGALAEGALVGLDVREANREREPGAIPLEPAIGRSYVALLDRSERQPKRLSVPLYRLVRGIEGMRSIPAEGAEAWIDAIGRLVAVRGLREDGLVWDALGELLLDRNPLLARAALLAHVTLQRGSAAQLPAVRTLLEDPRPEVRSLASTLGGICLRRAEEAVRDGSAREVALALVARARTDETADVRAAAVRALGALEDDATVRVLEEVAAKDPEQSVRYEARRLLYERSLAGTDADD